VNRRGFLGCLAAGMLAVAVTTKLGKTTLSTLSTNQDDLIALLSARIMAAEKTVVDVMAHSIYGGYEILHIETQDVISAAEYE
jgi:hypothetical protein